MSSERALEEDLEPEAGKQRSVDGLSPTQPMLATADTETNGETGYVGHQTDHKHALILHLK